eukprot:12536301-Ditylum_brightwellii.AAC.1
MSRQTRIGVASDSPTSAMTSHQRTLRQSCPTTWWQQPTTAPESQMIPPHTSTYGATTTLHQTTK